MDKLLPAEGPPGLKGERWCYPETERYWEVAQAEVDPLGCILGWLGFLAGVSGVMGTYFVGRHEHNKL